MTSLLIIRSEGIKLNLEKLAKKEVSRFRINLEDPIKKSYEWMYKTSKSKKANLAIVEKNKSFLDGTFYLEKSLKICYPHDLLINGENFSVDVTNDNYYVLEKSSD